MPHPLHLWILIFFVANAYSAPKNDTEPWNGKWFPLNPEKKQTVHSDLNELFSAPKEETKEGSTESWKGKWFPYTPGAVHDVKSAGRHGTDSTPSSECDDGRNNLEIDFDPDNKRHSYNYLCLDHKSKYEPSFATSPIQKEYIIPPAYKAPSYCLNRTIEYTERIPTFGPHRLLCPKYGEYKFLPVQRWMHNLEYGAIVMLYHPCAYQMQVEKLRSYLNACLYRHIITPSTLLQPSRPLALVAWGKSLEMSVVDQTTVVNFIKENAKKGANITQQKTQEYDAGLQVEAKLVTDESDSEICANINE